MKLDKPAERVAEATLDAVTGKCPWDASKSRDPTGREQFQVLEEGLARQGKEARAEKERELHGEEREDTKMGAEDASEQKEGEEGRDTTGEQARSNEDSRGAQKQQRAMRRRRRRRKKEDHEEGTYRLVLEWTGSQPERRTPQKDHATFLEKCGYTRTEREKGGKEGEEKEEKEIGEEGTL
ncbi:hypothetical protein NDU88_003687 [Pleurodeles waltl]|uniref:Uncharacterized protein n=1 Tax=Pleurodeles waltl TaxID=8319 RepID=A0AAV7QCE5_PLEWA|nr:hypothetical protein NDU88_003687 [Pleurodeles waltl]